MYYFFLMPTIGMPYLKTDLVGIKMYLPIIKIGNTKITILRYKSKHGI